jgi:hypothetical protein
LRVQRILRPAARAKTLIDLLVDRTIGFLDQRRYLMVESDEAL